LEENAGAADVALSKQELEEIEGLLQRYPNVGPRYNAREESFVKK